MEAMTANTFAYWNTPTRIRNSPTNPLRPGSPRLPSTNRLKKAAATGMGLAMPP